MTYMVSPCCGAEYSDNEDEGGSFCCNYEIRSGLCSKCYEHAEPEVGFICETCSDFFDEPIEDYEYKNQMLDAIAEDRADERRDLGL